MALRSSSSLPALNGLPAKGAKVRLTSCQSRPELNGTEGMIVSHKLDEDGFLMIQTPMRKFWKVRPNKLQQLDNQEPSCISCQTPAFMIFTRPSKPLVPRPEKDVVRAGFWRTGGGGFSASYYSLSSP
mmetsp:Transcript_53063/g.95121  ORF Transcript_53063/g.95121 Transcript_53063/m.95121 type:complete len:128 (-) Transcript_53063:176-559(-)|eukprot:CAMPEP_0197622904 /NCGR_PEP_ID=MMETSP1338-20131121/3012_1 /TAXON_ID=43686 ORGANISM="Pelagodinium beii, Strain RCC1491" /NCGR_SAMPLE_ID=MMETSP1338 /ASSEMBLY_ACC=CAM_ASM_000754 /LENGTH=127 /DNA_ID=CAMNT_0043192683 /DNA_START=32 /DNA_END=415 /DNA_ORIENTATION=+